jgi:hypothetical protein
MKLRHGGAPGQQVARITMQFIANEHRYTGDRVFRKLLDHVLDGGR